jgi:hypothetical protein
MVRPASERSYPPYTLLQIIFYGDDIVDVEEF